MNETFFAATSFSILIPAAIGIWRWRQIDRVFAPFLLLLLVGVLNELLSFLLIHNGVENTVTNNVYYLVESLLILYQFRNWQRFKSTRAFYPISAFVFVIVWLWEMFYQGSPNEWASYFIIFYSFATTLLSIRLVNALLAKEKKSLLRNSIFLIALGFILYFTYAILVEAFYLYGVMGSKPFQAGIVSIMAFVNLLTNLLFAIAVLWMPKKQRFSRLF